MFTGKTIAPGIAIGPAAVWTRAHEPVRPQQIAAPSVPAERRRLERAIERAQRELDELTGRVALTVGESAAGIFAAHLQVLHDRTFIAAILRRIDCEHLSAESAVDVTISANVRRFSTLKNSYLAARANDLIEIGDRLLAQLRDDGPREVRQLQEPRVLIAENLSAADVIALDRRHVRALVMVRAGATSHAALLASTMGVPVIASVPELLGQVHEGDTVIVDGNHGHVLANPTALALREYQTRREIFDRFRGDLAGLRDAPAVTADGRVVRLSANIGLPEEIPYSLGQGAEAIGLVRTEYFYLAHGEVPTEDEQYQFYADIVRAIGPRRVTFRAFDLGGDKMSAALVAPETNPMLGCRGIRLLLERRDLLLVQVRALLRASRHGPMRIIFPLITSLTEFQDTMALVSDAKAQLRARGVPFDEHVPFGCMVETPAAAVIADLLATEVEFFSIGSNDLIQYTLAADRGNPRVAHLYEPLHLAVLRMLRMVIRAARRRSRPVSLCGEMASDPIYTIILLGLGVDELSMNPEMIPAIKQIIRGVTWVEARDVARGVLGERRAKDVQSYLETAMASRFPQVMSVYGPDARDEPPVEPGTTALPITS